MYTLSCAGDTRQLVKRAATFKWKKMRDCGNDQAIILSIIMIFLSSVRPAGI